MANPGTCRVKQVWALGGGKGGVGKSLIASSLAITLSRMGNKVVAVDLDLGGANLHTTLGVDLPRQTLSDFFSGRVDSLGKCLTQTGINNLEMISGAQDAVGVANIPFNQKVSLLQKLRELDADYLVLDLGAGTSYNTLDFFLYSDIGLITLLPEPTSIENAYRFIKSAYYRKLSLSRQLSPVKHLIEMAMDSKNNAGIRSPSDLFRETNKTSPECGMRLKEEIEKFKPKLLVNQARTQTDVDIGFSVKTVCKKYFGVDMDYIGYLDYDSAVWQAVRRKRPLILEFPNSRLVSSVDRMVQYLLKRHGHNRTDIY
ncbi:MAG: ATP-binding protein [Bdellovibrionales bacterium RIFOXYD1_FULL_53_11]|nr:MAG: ATP-binding protein [Bdellovibrionales bacterium RIFOXYD1_FULL_53_11]